MKRIVVFGMLAAVLWTAENWWLYTQQPELASRLALEQLNGGDTAARALREFQLLKDSIHLGTALLTIFLFAAVFASFFRSVGTSLGKCARKFREAVSHKATLFVSVMGVAVMSGGCMKPYDHPEYVEIDTSETGFLIPLEGDGAQQARFQSEEYLKQRKVAAKRVQITHRWSQEGRMEITGRWIPSVRLVKVNRMPVTREWMSAENAQGVGTRRPNHNDKAIWIESADSVGFSMGFTCTSFISEEDAARFLYWYPSGSLAEVMDREVRGRIQQVAAEVAARYPLDQLRSRKQEISDAVNSNLTNFFATRGISITTVGMFGGMTYENPEIQHSIDSTFIAQQQKVVAEAKFEAQKKENERIELEAQGVAERARREAMGLADAKRTAAQAEAQAIREINRAAQEAQSNPLLLQLKAMELEKVRIEKWDGRFPNWWWGGSSMAGMNPNLMLQMPAPEGSRK